MRIQLLGILLLVGCSASAMDSLAELGKAGLDNDRVKTLFDSLKVLKNNDLVGELLNSSGLSEGRLVGLEKMLNSALEQSDKRGSRGAADKDDFLAGLAGALERAGQHIVPRSGGIAKLLKKAVRDVPGDLNGDGVVDIRDIEYMAHELMNKNMAGLEADKGKATSTAKKTGIVATVASLVAIATPIVMKAMEKECECG